MAGNGVGGFNLEPGTQPALVFTLGTVNVGSGTFKYGSVIGESPVVGVGLIVPKKSNTFPTVPTVPPGPVALISAKKIE